MQTLQTLFPQSKVESIDSNIDMTTTAGRSEYFSKCWEEWEANEVKVSFMPTSYTSMYSYITVSPAVREFAKKHDLHEFWDFLIKGNTVRFKDANIAMFFRLTI
jgi:hypothetical protein